MKDERLPLIEKALAEGISDPEVIRTRLISNGFSTDGYAALVTEARQAREMPVQTEGDTDGSVVPTPESTPVANVHEATQVYTSEATTSETDAIDSAPMAMVKRAWMHAFDRLDLVGWLILMYGLTLLMVVVPMFILLSSIGATTTQMIAPLLALGLLTVACVGAVVVQVLVGLAILCAFFSPQRISFWTAMNQGRQHFWSFSLVALITGVFTLTGMVFFLIPGIIIAVYLFLTQIVVVAEQKRGFAAVARSIELVRGAWWKTFGRFLLLIVPVQIIVQIIQKLTDDTLMQWIVIPINAFAGLVLLAWLCDWYRVRVVSVPVSKSQTVGLEKKLRLGFWFACLLVVLAVLSIMVIVWVNPMG